MTILCVLSFTVDRVNFWQTSYTMLSTHQSYQPLTYQWWKLETESKNCLNYVKHIVGRSLFPLIFRLTKKKTFFLTWWGPIYIVSFLQSKLYVFWFEWSWQNVKLGKTHQLLAPCWCSLHRDSAGWVFRTLPGTVSLCRGSLAWGSQTVTRGQARCSVSECRTESGGDYTPAAWWL